MTGSPPATFDAKRLAAKAPMHSTTASVARPAIDAAANDPEAADPSSEYAGGRVAWLLPWVLAACGLLTTLILSR